MARFYGTLFDIQSSWYFRSGVHLIRRNDTISNNPHYVASRIRAVPSTPNAWSNANRLLITGFVPRIHKFNCLLIVRNSVEIRLTWKIIHHHYTHNEINISCNIRASHHTNFYAYSSTTLMADPYTLCKYQNICIYALRIFPFNCTYAYKYVAYSHRIGNIIPQRMKKMIIIGPFRANRI